MKTLIILAVILGILFVYFIVKAEKSFVIKGSEVVPGGVDVPKLILNKAAEIKSQAIDKSAQILGNDIINGSGAALINKVKSDAEGLVSNAIDTMNKSIKNPIENKINETLCPKK